MRSKGAPGGLRGPRQASPRALAIGGGVIVAVTVAIVLGIVLSSSSKSPTASSGNYPKIGHHTWVGALQGASDVYALFKGIPESGLMLGSPNAPATLTEFIDLQCPVCKEFETFELPKLVPKYVRTGKLNIKMEPWSILDRTPTQHDSARGQAATIAAALQNKAFEFAEMLYFNQATEDTGWLTPDMVGKAASSVDGLKPRQVLNQLSSSGVITTAHTVDSKALAIGANSTPTLLLNHTGKKAVIVARSLPDLGTLESQIDAAIAG